MRILIVFLAGGVGAAARYVLGGWIAAAAGASFPWATLAVNAGGSFLLAGIMEIALATDAVPAPLRLALTTGLLGGFTTYSTFNYETMALLQQGSLRLAALNVALTVGGCLAAGLSGLVLARWIVGS